jgi:hypothetical protein
MKKVGCPLESGAWQHRLVGSVDLVPNRCCGEHINKQNWAKFAASTLYQARQRHALYGGTLLLKPYERLIKQLQPGTWSANRWMDHTGKHIRVDALKE